MTDDIVRFVLLMLVLSAISAAGWVMVEAMVWLVRPKDWREQELARLEKRRRDAR